MKKILHANTIKMKALVSYQGNNTWYTPLKASGSVLTNPIAFQHAKNPPQYTPEELAELAACRNSARLVIEKSQLKVLQDYFHEKSDTDTVMGKYYRELSFSDFFLRLYQKRYRTIYLNGRMLIPRSADDILAKAKSKFYYSHFFSSNPYCRYLDLISMIGSEADKSGLYREYLTVQEMMLTPTIIPQGLSIMIGTGSRDDHWPVAEEALAATDLAVLSSAVGPEFNDGATLHLDSQWIVLADQSTDQGYAHIEALKADKPLVNAARKLYGGALAIDFHPWMARRDKTRNFLLMIVGDQKYWLYKPAYQARLRTLLKTLLLSSDEAMHLANTGTVFNLKGLGLGAFGFSGRINQNILEQCYIDTVKSVLAEIAGLFKHITVVNLINLPSDWSDQNPVTPVSEYAGVSLIRSVMSPTEKTIPGRTEVIGGTHACGDSASMWGNEGQIGARRSDSDDPATAYSVLDPLMYDPAHNKRFQSTESIVVLDCMSNILEPYFEQSSMKPTTKFI